MFELSNEQRKYFALPSIDERWKRVIVKPSSYDDFVTIAYLDENYIHRIITINEDNSHDKGRYCEYQVEAELSEDKQFILPKTLKGKAKPFTSSNLLKLTFVGMTLSFVRGNVTISNYTSEREYYNNTYTAEKIADFSGFVQWIQNWCENTTEKQQAEIEEFACEKREHHSYKEGDFFRFRLNRDMYGYGRILLDFSKMRKDKVPFWDIFMGKPLCVGIYHIATKRSDVSIEELKTLMMMPSQMIMDNSFFYGDYKIIGNEPIVDEQIDYPIHYGNTINMKETGLRYQCGKNYIEIIEKNALYDGFKNGAIGWGFNLTIPILLKCIEEKSNQPYWDMYYPFVVDSDLRNPKFSNKLLEIKKQLKIR